ncbi:hypothetical protein ACHAWF_009342 [Thalassiosira exigua]
MLHLVATLVIWSHFFLIKFRELEGKVPAGAPYYWSKRIVPPLEFGSMHAILFQMALLPLTMSRYTISSLSNTWFDRFFPLNKMMRIHIHRSICPTPSLRHFTSSLSYTPLIENNVKWFSAPLLYYVCDYAMLYINQRFHTEVISFIAMKGRGPSRMGLMKLKRPTLFRFKPGQYVLETNISSALQAFLRAPEVDRFWHPVSMASDPGSSEIEFYLDIYERGSWTRRVWDAIISKSPDEHFTIEIMGTYGTACVHRAEFSHVIAMGSGTGIVPILSLFKEHVHQLLMLNQSSHYRAQHSEDIGWTKICRAKEARAKTLFQMLTSLTSGLFRFTHERETSNNDEDEPKAERKQVRVNEALRRLSNHLETIGPSHPTGSLGCHEHNGSDMQQKSSQYNSDQSTILPKKEALVVLVVSFQVWFAMLSFFAWNVDTIGVHIDVIISIANPFLDWYLVSRYQVSHGLSSGEIISEAIILTYMALRLWWRCVRIEAASRATLPVLESLSVVWTTRSSRLVAKLLPDLTEQWNSLVDQWGEDASQADPRALCRLQNAMSKSSLHERVFFHRPDLQQLLETHSIAMIKAHGNEYTSSLLTFCGSRHVSAAVEKAKIANDLIVSMAGHKGHHMAFETDSNGPLPFKLTSGGDEELSSCVGNQPTPLDSPLGCEDVPKSASGKENRERCSTDIP